MKGKKLREFMDEVTPREWKALDVLLKDNESVDVWDVQEMDDGVLVNVFVSQPLLYKDGRFIGLNPNYEPHEEYFKKKPKYLEEMRPKDWEKQLREINHPEDRWIRIKTWIDAYEAGAFEDSEEIREKAKAYQEEFKKF